MSEGRLLTRTELAAELGVNPITITKWQGEGLPVAEQGGKGRASRYRMAAVWLWGLARERARALGASEASGEMSLPVERARLARAQTEAKQLDVRRRSGELLERAEMKRAMILVAHAIKAGLGRLPGAVAERLVAVVAEGGTAVEVERLLQEAVKAALRELAAWEEPGDAGEPVS